MPSINRAVDAEFQHSPTAKAYLLNSNTPPAANVAVAVAF